MAEQPLAENRTVEYKHSRFTIGQREALLGYVLVIPVVLCLVTLVFYPFFFAIWISFTDRTVGTVGHFVGFANYARLARNSTFQATIVNTIVIVGAVQSIKLVSGIAIALLLNQQIRFRQGWRGLILLPWAMPAFVAFITWKLLYAPQGGAFNYILINLKLVDSHVDFLSSKEFARASVIVATAWQGFPFWVITFLAGLQAIPREMYEAAAIDGAGAIQRFRHITLPGIHDVILLVVLLSTIWTTNFFENIWLLTQGGPSDSTMTFPVLAYFGMQSLRIGEAAAVSVSMIPILAILALLIARSLQNES